MSRRKVPGQTGWTPRARVELWLMVAANRDRVDEAEDILENLRRVIWSEECQPDSVLDGWRIPAQE
jgi:hypothetical protein